MTGAELVVRLARLSGLDVGVVEDTLAAIAGAGYVVVPRPSMDEREMLLDVCDRWPTAPEEIRRTEAAAIERKLNSAPVPAGGHR